MTEKITELLHKLQQKRVPITAIEEIARRPGSNRDEIQREAGARAKLPA